MHHPHRWQELYGSKYHCGAEQYTDPVMSMSKLGSVTDNTTDVALVGSEVKNGRCVECQAESRATADA
jgi:hypothetical protein